MLQPSASLILAAFHLATMAEAKSPNFHRYASGVYNTLTTLVYTDTTAFGYWGQLASRTQLPMFSANADTEMTVIMPGNLVFEEFIHSYGGTTGDPAAVSTAEWVDRWNEHYEYFWFDGTLDTTSVGAGETVVLQSKKSSPAGDWPLPLIYYRRDDVVLEGNETYNGTISSFPYGEGNITSPDFPTTPYHVQAQVVDFWPTQPKSLTITLTQANFSEWATLTYRVPALLDLDTTYNFTLLLPPSSILSAALNLTDSALSAFIEAHIVSNERLILQPTIQSSNSGLSYQNTWIATAGGVNATVVVKNVMTSGGVVQLINRALVSLNGSIIA